MDCRPMPVILERAELEAMERAPRRGFVYGLLVGAILGGGAIALLHSLVAIA